MSLEVPYLVVGAGPVGLTAAHLLTGRGCLVVERRDGPLRHPAAHVVNARTLEIFRQAGIDMASIEAIATDPADAGHVNYVTRLAGELIGRLPFERQGPEVEQLTPTPLRNISQHRLEPILADAVRAMPEVELRYRTEWVASTQDADGVTSTIRDLDTGATIDVRSRHVLAADGAASAVRKSLGIDMVGPPALQSFIAIHVAADLRAVIADRLGVLHFVMDPAANGVFIAHDIDREWVFMTSYHPAEESVDDYDVHRCAGIVRRALGDADADIEVLNVGAWHMSAQVAARMRAERIFLIGDAAHRFPPTGGLGLNTGVADAHGLVWRLLAVDDGWAPTALLDTYEIERRPVAAANCEQSTANAFKLISLIEALGITATPTTEGLHDRLADPARRDAIGAAVRDQATHFDMIGLQLGYCYADGALVRHGEAPPPIADPSRFEPSAAVGTRLPHAWLTDGRSTLDLIEPGMLTLVSAGRHATWTEAISEVVAPIRHIELGVDAEAPASWVEACELGVGEALLVRPDQHVAWRSGANEPASGRALGQVVATVLGATRTG